MSFSSDVKEELSRQINSARHCRIAELAAIISLCGRIQISQDNRYVLTIHTESIMVARKFYMLVEKLFEINIQVLVRHNSLSKNSRLYLVVINDNVVAKKILQTVKLLNMQGEIEENLSIVKNIVIQNMCCRRAFIRGAFLAVGSVSDPEKTYHFELCTSSMAKATQLQQIVSSFDIDAKIVQRKKYYIVYVKEGAQIVDMLNIMEAHVSMMELENVRILKEVRNSVNRQVNCETANINKTVNAASRQIEDILYIKNNMGFGELSDGLRNIAELRIEYPDMPLKELGLMLDNPIGKSGVNHRLKKLSIIAEGLRERLKEEE